MRSESSSSFPPFPELHDIFSTRGKRKISTHHFPFSSTASIITKRAFCGGDSLEEKLFSAYLHARREERPKKERKTHSFCFSTSWLSFPPPLATGYRDDLSFGFFLGGERRVSVEEKEKGAIPVCPSIPPSQETSFLLPLFRSYGGCRDNISPTPGKEFEEWSRF